MLSAIPENPRGTHGRPPLSRDRIVESALVLAKEQGLAAVSMRRLAKELGVQPMSLYYHLPSRAVLMVLMAERSLESLPDPVPTAPWDERLVTLLVGAYQAGVDDPAVFPVLASETLGTRMVPSMPIPAGGASVGLIERVQDLLAEAGVPELERPGRCRGLFALVVGFLVGQVDGLVPTGGEDSPETEPGDGLGGADVDGADDDGSVPPAMQAMHRRDPQEDLAAALRVVVRGLAAQFSG